MSRHRSAWARILASTSRVEIMHVLQDRGPSTIDVLVDATDLHPNTVREHLARLIEGDLVRSEPEKRTTRGRPRMTYRATSSADIRNDPEAASILERSIAQAALTEALVRGFSRDGAADRAREAGREVGRGLGQSGDAPEPDSRDRELLALSAHLDSFGFDPELERENLTYHLWRCPFKEMAQERPDVVCAVHAGLAQGVLDQAGGSLGVAELTPFVGPSHCTLRLIPRQADGDA